MSVTGVRVAALPRDYPFGTIEAECLDSGSTDRREAKYLIVNCIPTKVRGPHLLTWIEERGKVADERITRGSAATLTPVTLTASEPQVFFDRLAAERFG